MWRPRWHNFGTKPLFRLEKNKTSFSSASTLDMDWIGLIRWIWASLLWIHERLLLFTTLSPQEHHDLKLDLITFHVTRLSLKKVDKVGLHRGLCARELGRCLGRVQSDPYVMICQSKWMIYFWGHWNCYSIAKKWIITWYSESVCR